MKFHSLNLIFLMIRYILIIILTLGNLCEIPVAAPYVLNDFIDFDSNLYFKQFIDSLNDCTLCFEGLYRFWLKSIL